MSTTKKNGPLVSFLMRHNMAKNENTANGILIGVTVINFFITFAVASSTFASIGFFPRHEEPTYREDIPANVLKNLPPEVLSTIPSRNDAKNNK